MLQTGRVEVSEEDGATLLTMLGEHDLETAPALDRSIRESLENGPVVVDLSSTAFVDSSVLTVLVRACESDSNVALVVPGNAPIAVTRVFELTGLRERLPVHETTERAIASLGA